jgi:hypothetical protein
VDTRHEADCYDALADLIADHESRESIRQKGLRTAARYSIEGAVDSEITLLQKHWRARVVRPQAESPLASRGVAVARLKPSRGLRDRWRRYRRIMTRPWRASA